MNKNEVIEQCIKIVKSHIEENCDDHTPFWGACVSCGRSDNFDLIKYPEDLIEELEKLKDE